MVSMVMVYMQLQHAVKKFSAVRVLSSAVPQRTKAIIKNESGNDLLCDGLWTLVL